ncbi:DUF4136 domain-containing protein [Novosphingobium aquimarinum]|uniref:DUF4136 domain-containing protein n=1 Tax=Novosphingobium aquimarinum TaxID=2682494 RepID=UPI0012EC7D5B|nr:DUF4136 domain-containing protein [Novosphingobium aquimarinum]
MKSIIKIASVSALLLTSACVAPVGPVEVTRFHLPEAQSRASGPITVVAAPGEDGASIEFATYAAAVRRELQRIGYAPADVPGGQIAELGISRAMLSPQRRRGPVSVGIGGGTGGFGSGVGVGVGIDLSGPPPEQVETEMRVTIRDRVSGQAIWEGRSRFMVKADSPMAETSLGASRLAEALFKAFPGQSGETIYVE